ncbi:organic solvent ABC transporter permease [Marinobacter sp. C2H3]|uniref:organic solvent ABC transporter permease n=1 Tax=Marinobacter sp. C2H3 TaxID=3119003 RepID=UPI00300EF5F8
MKPAQRLSALALLLTTLGVAGCGGGGGGGGNDASTGQVNANGISGLNYQTASQSGTTSARGEFRYYPGETLSFAVGDLALVSGVPAQRYVTPLEFFAVTRNALTDAMVDSQNLRSHRLTEQQLLQNNTLMNLTRFLMSLDWTEGVKEGEGIEIRQRVIDQLNRALPNVQGAIDFTVPPQTFAATGASMSPANQLLAQICFYEKDDELCEAPPTQAEIDGAPIRPDDEALWDPNVEYRQDLINKRDRILNAVRSIDDVATEDARDYLTHELDAITTVYGNRYYLDDDIANVAASDTAIKSVTLRKIGGTPSLQDIEAISTRPVDVTVHSWSWQTAQVEYFVSGDAGGSSELLINFRPDDTYRWIRKSLRVRIE